MLLLIKYAKDFIFNSLKKHLIVNKFTIKNEKFFTFSLFFFYIDKKLNKTNLFVCFYLLFMNKFLVFNEHLKPKFLLTIVINFIINYCL